MNRRHDTTILLVEEDVLIAKATALKIKDFGYDVVIAHSGENAIKRATDHNDISLILMDANLGGGIDGIEAARQILAVRHLPIVFLVSHTEEACMSSVKAIPRYGFVLKNSDDFVLQSSMEMALELFRKQEKNRLQNEELQTANEKLRKANYDLKERIKELNCIHEFAKIVETHDHIDDIIGGLLAVLQRSWQYPDITAVRITHAGHISHTHNFSETPWQLSADIITEGEQTGQIEIVYLEQKPEEDEGPFLKEERIVLDTIAERLGRTIERIRKTQEYANLFHTLNEAVLKADANGLITAANRAAAELSGYDSPDELIGLPMTTLYASPESRPALVRKLREEGGEFHNFEFLLKRKDGTTAWTLCNIKLLRNKAGEFIGTLGALRDISELKKATEALQRIEWLLTKSVTPTDPDERPYQPPYGDVTELNTCRVILDSVGKDTLKNIAEDTIDLLDTSVAVYEKNGDYAFGMFSSGWCRFFDPASRRLCGDLENRDALRCGKWLCHENCWNDSAKAAIETRQPTDIACIGGIRLYAVPIVAGDEIVGAINIGYGDPPTDEQSLLELAERFDVDLEDIRNLARTYRSRPLYIIELAKKRLHTTAKLIGEIVERKKTEEKLKAISEKNSLFSAVVENSDNIIVVKDLNLRVLATNQAFADAAGYKSAEMMTGKTDAEIFRVSLDSEPVSSYMADERKAQSLKKGEYILREEPVITPEGKKKIVLTKKYPIFNDQDKLIATGNISVDITDRKQAEQALVKNQTILKNAEEISDIGSYEMDIQTGELTFSDGWLRIHGCAKKTMTLDELMPIAHPDDIPKIEKAFDDALKNIRPYDIEHRIIRRNDGEVRIIRVSSKMVFNEQGQPLKLYGAVQDISEQKQAEKALKESEERLRTLVNTSPFPVAVADTADEKILYWSQSAQDMFGHTPWVVSEWYALAYPDPHYRQEVIHRWKPYLEKARHAKTAVNTGEYRIMCRDGSVKICELYVKFIPGSLVVTFNDITERKQAEEKIKEYSQRLEEMVEERTQELNKTQEELIKKERLAVLGHFAGSISHELRNPLAVIDAAVYLLNMKLKNTDDKIQTCLKSVSNNVKKSTDIIQSLLNLSQMEKPKTKKTDLTDLVSETLRSSKIPETIELILNLPDESVFLDVEKEQIRMVLKNIIKNAVQAMDEKGKLTILFRSPQTGYIETHIADTGNGILPEHAEKIFEPLFSTKTHGIGFGLSITKMIVENHGGTIRVESDLGKGATFIITLPLVLNDGEKRDENSVGG